MSYDIDVYCPCCESTLLGLGNYTSNMKKFFVDFGVYPKDFDGGTPESVREALKAGLANILVEIRKDRAALDTKYNPANKWGNVQSAINWLTEMEQKLAVYAVTHPDKYKTAKVTVSA